MTKMTVSQIIDQLSPAARKVLEGMGSDRIGTVVPLGANPALVFDLQEFGVVGVNGGLTIKGSAVVARVKPELGRGMNKMSVSQIIDQLSPQARKVLEGMGSDRIGTNVTERHGVGGAVASELRVSGVIGMRGGLTVKGSAVVCKIKPELEF